MGTNKYDTEEYDNATYVKAVTVDAAAESILILKSEIALAYEHLVEAQDFGLKLEKENAKLQKMLMIMIERDLLQQRY